MAAKPIPPMACRRGPYPSQDHANLCVIQTVGPEHFVDGRQPLPNRVTSELPVIHPQKSCPGVTLDRARVAHAERPPARRSRHYGRTSPTATTSLTTETLRSHRNSRRFFQEGSA